MKNIHSYNELILMLKKCRNTLNVVGYYDEVQAIDDLLKEYDTPTGNDETLGLFVVLHFFPHEPVQVYGLFDTETEARKYAESQGFANNGGAYDVHDVLKVQMTYQWRREAWE